MLRLSEVVEATGLSADSLRRRCRAGEIAGAVLDGKTWYIPRAGVAKIKRRQRASVQPLPSGTGE